MANKKAMRDWLETHLEKPTIVIAFLLLAILLVPYVYPFEAQDKSTFKVLEVAFWALFSLEYGVRVFLAKDRWYFIRRHPIDFFIVFIPPIQFLHVIRTLSLTAYFIRKARNLFFERNAWFLLTMAPLMLIVSSILMYQSEGKVRGSNIKTFGDSLWWGVTTMSTFGYGDRYPVTNTGRMIASLTIIVGIILISILTAEIAIFFIGTRAQEISRDKENFSMVMKKLESMEKEIRDSKDPESKESKG